MRRDLKQCVVAVRCSRLNYLVLCLCSIMVLMADSRPHYLKVHHGDGNASRSKVNVEEGGRSFDPIPFSLLVSSYSTEIIF